jgi:hypothetical protein
MHSEGNRFKLTISALEFYMFQGFDLLNGHKPIVIDPKFGELNPHTIEIKEMSDLFNVIDTIDKQRTTVATKMNMGSSRSHAALILTLH